MVSEYIPQDDESEATRVASMRAGVGEPLFEDAEIIKSYALDEFSLGGALGDLDDIPR